MSGFDHQTAFLFSNLFMQNTSYQSPKRNDLALIKTKRLFFVSVYVIQVAQMTSL